MRLKLVLPLLLLTLAPAAQAEQAPRRIVVTGSAEVEAAPDLATITAGVRSRAETAEAAMQANAAAMNAVFDALDGAGVARADAQTSRLALMPVWQDRRDTPDAMPEIAGYEAQNMLTIRVRALDTLGGVIDALASAGANEFNDIGFALDDPRQHLDAARERAVADARSKAELYAGAAGVTLGDVLTIREAGYSGGPMPMMRQRAEMAMDTPVAEGTLTLSAQVEVVFGLAGGKK